MTANLAWNIWNFRRGLVEHLLMSGHEVIVFAPRDESTKKLEKLGCEFLPLKMSRRGINPFEGLSLIRQFRSAIKKKRPDHILSFTIKNNIFGAIAARQGSAHFVPNVTGLGTAFLSGALLSRVARSLYKLAFRNLPTVFFQNEDDFHQFREMKLIDHHQGKLLPGSGIDLDRFDFSPLPSSDEKLIFLMVSRLIRDKGIAEYTEAASALKTRYPHAEFQLLGGLDPDNRSAIDDGTLEAWVENGAITYLPPTDDVRPFMKNAHCIVLPSYREGAPRTLIEGAAIGRPLITTDVPGCRSVVDEGMNGFFCEVRDVASLASKIEKFIELSDDGRKRMSMASRKKAENEFSEKLVIEKYREALDARHA